MSFIEKYSTKLAFITATTAVGVFALKYFICKLQNDKRSKHIIIQSVKDWNDHEKEILSELYSSSFIGMDCEWVTTDGNRKPISLLQLANNKGFCVLIRLPRISVGLIPPCLSKLLKDRNILKVGVGVVDDATKLFHDYCIEVSGLIDLRHLAEDLYLLQGKSLGLKSLAKELLNYNMNKSYTLRCSDWDAESLTSDQIRYAADDAIVSAKLFDSIKARKNAWFSSNGSCFNDNIDLYIDIPFKQKNNSYTVTKNASEHSVIKYKSGYRYREPRKKPVYDNCRLLAPDGELLCICERRKAERYVKKRLGEVINEEPYTVKLNFEPVGRSRSQDILYDAFYTMEKTNICVACGKPENLYRKFIVPLEYRNYFPNVLKKNVTHDIVPLCINCHKRSNILDQEMRIKLAELCDAPINSGKYAKYVFIRENAQVKGAGRTLILSGDKLPESQKIKFENIITDYFKASELTKELIVKASNLDANVLNESFIPHGLKVYQYFCNNDGLFKLEKMWRQHFLNSMKPKYLPDMWSVDHNHKRVALQIINNELKVDFDVSILGLESEFMN